MCEKRYTDEMDKDRRKKKRHESNFYAAAVNERISQNVAVISCGWKSHQSLVLSDFDMEIQLYPFKHCIVRNFFKQEDFAKELKDELLKLDFVAKKNDLYEYHQSRDLSTAFGPYINKLKQFLQEECRVWIEKVTGLKLDDKVSSTCSSYCKTEHLLCHDDKCEDRRIAFIIYLNEAWTEENGGELQLFDTDGSGEPNEVVKSIPPMFNSLVFFEVSCRSYHQVSEVLSPDRTRISVNGWYHGLVEPECSKPVLDTVIFRHVAHPAEIDPEVMRCVNQNYLKPDIQAEVRAKFEAGSEIQLTNFLNSTFYQAVCESLLPTQDLYWKIEGPPNRRRYETLHGIRPAPIVKLLELLTSESFFRFLETVTQLELIPVSSEGICRPYCSYEVQQWRSGFYTLIHDDESTKEVLDVILHLNVVDFNREKGGQVSYVDREENEELLIVDPVSNGLALTFRDQGTISFNNYINSQFEGSFQAVSLQYCEMTQFEK